jgi:hypothetical protein
LYDFMLFLLFIYLFIYEVSNIPKKEENLKSFL